MSLHVAILLEQTCAAYNQTPLFHCSLRRFLLLPCPSNPISCSPSLSACNLHPLLNPPICAGKEAPRSLFK